MNIKKIKKSKIEIYVRGDATAHKSGTNMSPSLISNSLTITTNKNTKSANFDIGLSYQPIDYLDYGYNVQVYIDDILFFGGYISSTKTDILYKVIKVECVSHNTLMYHRLNINNFDYGDSIADADNIGDYVSMIYDRYLKAYGKGTIHKGIAIDNIDFDIYQYKNNYIHDILDDFTLIAAQNNTNIGALGAYRWGITDDGIFYFMRQKELADKNDWLTNSDYYITDDNATIDFSLSSGYHDYRNTQVILGGYPDDDISDSNLTDDGKIFYIKKDQEEIDKVKSRLHNNGIFEAVYEDGTISTLQGADAIASQLLAEYGHIERVLEIKTFDKNLQNFEIGDKVKVAIKKMQGEYEDKISSELYIVQNKTTVDIDDGRIEIMYTLYKYGTSNNRINFYDYLKPTKQTNTQKSDVIKLPSKLRKIMKTYWINDSRNIMKTTSYDIYPYSDRGKYIEYFYPEESKSDNDRLYNRTYNYITKIMYTGDKNTVASPKNSNQVILNMKSSVQPHYIVSNIYNNINFMKNVVRYKMYDTLTNQTAIRYNSFGYMFPSNAKYVIILGYIKDFDTDNGFLLGKSESRYYSNTGSSRINNKHGIGFLDYVKTKKETEYIKNTVKPNDLSTIDNESLTFKKGKYTILSKNNTNTIMPRLTSYVVDTNVLAGLNDYYDFVNNGYYSLYHDYYILGFVEITDNITPEEEDIYISYFDSLMEKKYEMDKIISAINKIDADVMTEIPHKDL